jgi:hypothetical protein
LNNTAFLDYHDPINPINMRMTWAGHEFLDAAREDTRWKKAMDIVRDKGRSVTFEVLKALLISLIKTAVGLDPRGN